MKALTTNDFIQKSKLVHNDKYCYDLVQYITKKTKIRIVCPKHGEFLQTPDAHLRGQGCPKCKSELLNQTRNTPIQTFINKANNIHNNYYDYSKVVYVNYKTPCIIICPKHGEFLQTPNAHLVGKGCPKCAKLKMSTNYKYTEQELLNNVQIKHPNYKFQIINYKGNQTLFKCTCLKHGDFYKTYQSLIMHDNICKKCFHHYYTYDELIQLFNNKHNNKFIYPYFEYKSISQKIDIICPKHGVFKQTIYHHLNDNGCPICKTSKGETFIYTLLNNNNIKFQYQYKIKINQKSFIVDFYIPDFNLYIEYNGRQHYESIDYFGGNIAFKNQQNRDNILREYCNNCNINLLEIKFDLSESEIIQLINNYIQSHP